MQSKRSLHFLQKVKKNSISFMIFLDMTIYRLKNAIEYDIFFKL
jgi:hypothetical protein